MSPTESRVAVRPAHRAGTKISSSSRPRPPGSYRRAKAFIEDAVANDAPPSRELIVMNERLNAWERYRGIGKVASFPVMVKLPISNVCNARCLFCPYEPTRVRGSLFSVEDFARADWLKFVRSFSPTSGLTEPLAHPQIAGILREVRRLAPFITLTMTTNASLLTDPVIEAITGHLKWMMVSINAARKATYESLMGLKWDTTTGNLRRLHARKVALGTDLPRVVASVVVHRNNIDEIEEMPALLASLGIDRVRLLVMKVPAPFTVRTLFGRNDHLANMPIRANRAFEAFERECGRRGVQHVGIIPFLPTHRPIDIETYDES